MLHFQWGIKFAQVITVDTTWLQPADIATYLSQQVTYNNEDAIRVKGISLTRMYCRQIRKTLALYLVEAIIRNNSKCQVFNYITPHQFPQLKHLKEHVFKLVNSSRVFPIFNWSPDTINKRFLSQQFKNVPIYLTF